MKVKSLKVNRVKQFDNLIFILSTGTLQLECEKCGKEKQVMVCGGFAYANSMDGDIDG